MVVHNIVGAKSFADCIKCFTYQRENPGEFTDTDILKSTMRLSLAKAVILTDNQQELEQVIGFADEEGFDKVFQTALAKWTKVMGISPDIKNKIVKLGLLKLEQGLCNQKETLHVSDIGDMVTDIATLESEISSVSDEVVKFIQSHSVEIKEEAEYIKGLSAKLADGGNK